MIDIGLPELAATAIVGVGAIGMLYRDLDRVKAAHLAAEAKCREERLAAEAKCREELREMHRELNANKDLIIQNQQTLLGILGRRWGDTHADADQRARNSGTGGTDFS